MSHTPVPWSVLGKSVVGPRNDADSNQTVVAMCNMRLRNADECQANAELIVRAVNCHDELVKACEIVMRDVAQTGQGKEYVSELTIMRVRDALAKAKGVPS